MAIINKTSVRDELDRLKGDFDRLSDEQKISGETKMLMRSMFTLLELIFAIFLEKKTTKTTKTSKNSSIPSSQTDKDESALDQSRSNTKGKKEQNRLLIIAVLSKQYPSLRSLSVIYAVKI